MPRFVLLYHELPQASDRPSHWDLMLERDGVLRTWALEQLPQAGVDVPCRALADHRLAYLDYEGAVSGNRGEVTRVDCGEYSLALEAQDELRVQIAGQTLRGLLLLKRSAASGGDWQGNQSWVARLLPESAA